MLYKDFLTFWLENYVKPDTKFRTYLRYSQIVRIYVAEKVGEYDLSELTPIILQTFIADMLTNGNGRWGADGLAPNTVNSIVSVLKNSLKTAYMLGCTDRQLGDKIKRPKVRERKIECFSIREQRKIENAVLTSRKHKYFGVLLCLYTGLRIGEVVALKWNDIDLKKGMLSVNKTCYDTPDGLVFDDPKTVHSRRIIPLPRQIMPILREKRKTSKSDFVVSEKGKPVSVRSFQRSFELLLKRHRIEHRGFHSLRHTFATRALESGMDVKTLSEILGHKNPSITLSRYAHSLMEHKSAMMNRLGKLL
ncbi:MAG: site-specific integrase [Bacilli bacterium]|nr:site-specific integrase [Bacilli bacterium]